jgi:hypothetical protein
MRYEELEWFAEEVVPRSVIWNVEISPGWALAQGNEAR